jgi:serine/threonine protein kinase
MRFGRFDVDPQSRKEGGQAFVYFTTDPISKERVAVKVARPTQWSRKRMRQEIKAQEDLTHPNILPVLVRAEDYTWYAMRRAECSLDELGPFSPPQWMHLRAGLLGITSAVAHAHSRGYVHRDLSSGNVLIFAHGWAVSDWGFVYMPPKGGIRMTQPLERFGTPEFMAPEMAVDPTDVGPAADIYSIGRLAAWGTGLQRGDGDPNDSAVVRWWRLLIDRTTEYEPRSRWTMRDLETHLRSPVPLSKPPQIREPSPEAPILVRRGEPCPHCGSDVGRDQSERCLTCHVLLPY